MATQGRRQEEEQELSVQTRCAYFLEGRGGGIGPGRGTPGGEGVSQVLDAESLLGSHERKVFSRHLRPTRALRAQLPSLRSGLRPSPAPGRPVP